MEVEKAAKMMQQAALVSQKIREALQASLPVAAEQLMTVQIPGTIIDTTEKGPYVWNANEESSTPHRVRVNESRLVDNMIPLSKVMMGVTGKSVARSYAAALDMLVPEDAPVDINKTTVSKTAAAERYVGAMNYLTSISPGTNKSVIDIYVEKQQAYSEAMNKWEAEKAKTRAAAKEHYPSSVSDQQRYYNDWNQENFRNFKNNTQAKYMDWIVNGNKYKVDYYFGIVDVSSAMKRVESSKEAARNLVVIDPDGSTEWQAVSLTPANWATICRDKVTQWQVQNSKLSRKDFESEIKRLRRLLLSYTGMKSSIDPDGSAEKKIQTNAVNAPDGNAPDVNAPNGSPPDGKVPDGKVPDGKVPDGKVPDGNAPGGDSIEAANGGTVGNFTNGNKRDAASDNRRKKPFADKEDPLAKAYMTLYNAQHAKKPDPKTIRQAQEDLQKALEADRKANLVKNKQIASDLSDNSKAEKLRWINNMIIDVESQLASLEERLEALYKGSTSTAAITNVVKTSPEGKDSEEDVISTQYSAAGDEYADPKFNIPRNDIVASQTTGAEASKWTKISLTVSASSQSGSKETISSITSASYSSGWWLWGASSGLSHSQASIKASNSTANCTVEVKFEALLVTIDRSWLHGELFNDPELNTSPDFSLSPGASTLHAYINEKNSDALAKYPYFPSYPTGFIIASNVELEFHGDTTDLEEAVESSHTDAQVSVGWGPFSLSGSHSQDKTSAKTKMETTATGTRISLEAPAIIGWISQLVPQLPRPKGTNFLVGPMV